MKNKIDSLISKIKIHIETTEECMENFNIDNTTKELLSQDNKFLSEILNELGSIKSEGNDTLLSFINWYNKQNPEKYIPNSEIGKFNLNK